MVMMKLSLAVRRILLPFFFVLTMPVVGLGATDELRGVAVGFYAVYTKVRPLGVPDDKGLEKFRPYLSAPLRQLLKGAWRAEQNYHERTHGQAPPLMEGDLFTSLFEGATAFEVLACEETGARGACTVEFSTIDPRNRSTFEWKDKVLLVRQGRGWVVDDVEYLGDWPFMHKGRLKDTLRQAIAEGNKR